MSRNSPLSSVQHAIRQPEPMNVSETLGTAADLASTVGELTAVVAVILQDAPYVQSIAGVLTQIIKIRDEMKFQKERCNELIDKVLRRSHILFSELLQIRQSLSHPALVPLEKDLEAYWQILQQIHQGLCEFSSRGVFKRLVDRGTAKLDKYNRMIDDFNDVTSFKMLAQLVRANAGVQPASSVLLPQTHFKPMPSAPIAMFGRNLEKNTIIQTLLNAEHPRIAILGSGGMGKTTLALSILHAPEIMNHYKNQYFTSCEAATSLDLLLSELADVLQIPPDSRDSNLYNNVLHRLNQQSTILCLDNFETTWVDVQPRRPVDDLLGQLNSLSNVSILITMRGAERPTGIAWSKPLFPALQPLQLDDTMQILAHAAGHETLALITGDKHICKLVQEVEGLPLAASLMGHLLQDGIETGESLWNRWQEEHTSIIKTDNSDRLYSLDVSIQLSINCRYMKEVPDAVQLLRVLALIPDGFPDSTLMKKDLQQHFPIGFAFSDALQTLRRVSLVYIDQRTQAPRIRLLPPIQRFCQAKLRLSSKLQLAITTFYAKFIVTHNDYGIAAHHVIVPPELANVQSLLLLALQSDPSETFLKASINYTDWTCYIGILSREVILLATERATSPQILADCLLSAGKLHFHGNDLNQAEKSFKHAIELYQQTQDALGEANSLQNLGQVQMRRSDPEGAEKSFNHAIELHQQAHFVLGQADDLRNLGQVQMHQNEFEKAEKSFMLAIELHQQVHSVLGEAYDFQNLGRVQMHRSELEEAEKSFKHAIELHQQAHSVLGEAHDLCNLGQVQMHQSELQEAEKSFNHAIELHQQAQSVLGEANDYHVLAELRIEQHQLNAAEACLNRALSLHKQAQDPKGERWDHQLLDKLHELQRGETEGHEMGSEGVFKVLQASPL